MRIWSAILLGVLLVPAARSQEPLGSQFVVNSERYFIPTDGRVAVQEDDGFLVVWTSVGSLGSDDDIWSIQGRLFASDRSPTGPQFQINNYTTSGQTGPEIALGADGRFFVVWTSDGSFGDDNNWLSVQGRLVEADGQISGVELQINTLLTGDQRGPAVAASDSGFVVVWNGSQHDVFGQRFDLNASPMDSEFQVNTAPYRNSVSGPEVASAPDGSFVVVWISDSPGTVDDHWVRARRYDALGQPLGDEFSVNLDLDRLVLWPEVIVMPDGGFSVFWQEDTNMLWRRFALDGMPLSGEMLLSDTRPGWYDQFAVSRSLADELVAVWRSDPGRGSPIFATLRGKAILAPTSALAPFDVSADEAGREEEPGLAHFSDGSFLVIWSRHPHDLLAERPSLRAQVFAAPSPLFVDGFESGDESSWSTSAP